MPYIFFLLDKYPDPNNFDLVLADFKEMDRNHKNVEEIHYLVNKMLKTSECPLLSEIESEMYKKNTGYQHYCKAHNLLHNHIRQSGRGSKLSIEGPDFAQGLLKAIEETGKSDVDEKVSIRWENSNVGHSIAIARRGNSLMIHDPNFGVVRMSYDKDDLASCADVINTIITYYKHDDNGKGMTVHARATDPIFQLWPKAQKELMLGRIWSKLGNLSSIANSAELKKIAGLSSSKELLEYFVDQVVLPFTEVKQDQVVLPFIEVKQAGFLKGVGTSVKKDDIKSLILKLAKLAAEVMRKYTDGKYVWQCICDLLNDKIIKEKLDINTLDKNAQKLGEIKEQISNNLTMGNLYFSQNNTNTNADTPIVSPILAPNQAESLFTALADRLGIKIVFR